MNELSSGDLLERLTRALERIAAAVERQSASAVSSVEPEALSKEDAARFLGVDEGTVEHLIRTRKLAYVQHGEQRGRVIPIDALRAFLGEYRQATGEEMHAERKRA
ncbi:MAG: helix-turn-helix domain-containing protein [Gemmataceae bacterium]